MTEKKIGDKLNIRVKTTQQSIYQYFMHAPQAVNIVAILLLFFFIEREIEHFYDSPYGFF